MMCIILERVTERRVFTSFRKEIMINISSNEVFSPMYLMLQFNLGSYRAINKHGYFSSFLSNPLVYNKLFSASSVQVF